MAKLQTADQYWQQVQQFISSEFYSCLVLYLASYHTPHTQWNLRVLCLPSFPAPPTFLFNVVKSDTYSWSSSTLVFHPNNLGSFTRILCPPPFQSSARLFSGFKFIGICKSHKLASRLPSTTILLHV